MSTLVTPSKPLFTGSDWDWDRINRTCDAIEVIASQELGLNTYPNRIEIITAEQMLDAYSSIGMPLMYNHWSFGKHRARDEMLYRTGQRGLAYEIVINSSPCVSYLMEENTMAMQTLVLAHAAFGHNHFFKNNCTFQQWTDASAWLDYMEFVKNYIVSCEERYGLVAVTRTLDAAHALMSVGVHRYPKKAPLDLGQEMKREADRREEYLRTYNDLWRTVPTSAASSETMTEAEKRRRQLRLPEENMLYFLEKNSPTLEVWQREILRIVRTIAQYFYPQRQTKVMNEGCATMVHYYILNRLHENGLITEGAMLECLHSHTSVVFQPRFDDPRFSGFNPYYLGFEMMQDIKRVVEKPTDEDRDWFPDIAGQQDTPGVWRDIWANYRDESFIRQFLSPALIRKMGLFMIYDGADQSHLLVERIHNEQGYRDIRQRLAASYDPGTDPDIQVIDVDLQGDRTLHLEHTVRDGILLEKQGARKTLHHIAALWGYAVQLVEADADTGLDMKTHKARAPKK